MQCLDNLRHKKHRLVQFETLRMLKQPLHACPNAVYSRCLSSREETNINYNFENIKQLKTFNGSL